jgi:hypothetical protein
LYAAPDGFQATLGVVLMGTDRTSIHKPEFCLTSQGWQIVRRERAELPLATPPGSLLPVQRFTVSYVMVSRSGNVTHVSGVFVFWFVAEDRVTASHQARVGQMAWDLLRTGVLPRWAYVTCFTTCAPGHEEAAYERLKRFLAAAVPAFQTSLPARTNPQVGTLRLRGGTE